MFENAVRTGRASVGLLALGSGLGTMTAGAQTQLPATGQEAARWSKDNSGVKAKALEDAMQKQAWDPSVKALTAVPQTLQMMNDRLEWMPQLGDAFLAQQQDVMTAVQKLPARAEAAGNLKSTPQQKVTKSAPPAGVTAPPRHTAGDHDRADGPGHFLRSRL